MSKRKMLQLFALINKFAKFSDLEPDFESIEDDEAKPFESYPEDERFEYLMGGKHPNPHVDDKLFDKNDINHELKEPIYKFDPDEHLEGGGSIIGKDDAPYIENDEGKHYDIYPTDDEILDEEDGELNLLDEIHNDLKNFDLTNEDREYLKNLNINIDEEDDEEDDEENND